MSTTTLDAQHVPVAPGGRLLTVADVAALPTELPSGSVDYELDNGRIVVMAPPGDVHGSVQLRIGSALLAQGEQRGLGQAWTEVGIVLWRDPDRLVGADAAFVARPSLPVRTSEEGYLETIPELVVEVRSKNDTDAMVARKVSDYLAAGVRVVWLADPARQTIIEHRATAPPRTFSKNETLCADDVVPGFALPIADVFR
jgi:Uma2 family endonuclease